MLFEAATGVRPFRGSSLLDVLREVVTAHPAPPRPLRAALPSGWDGILNQTLAKDRSRRFQSAADLFQALEALRSSPQPAAYRVEEREPDRVWA